MGYMGSFRFILLLILSAVFDQGYSDDTEYVAWFSDDVSGCKDFDNKMLKVDLHMEPISDYMLMGLSGEIEFTKEVTEENILDLEVSKKRTMSVSDLIFAASVKFCKSLDDEDAPWLPVLEQMGISKCPIPIGVYPIKNLTLDIAFIKDHLQQDNIGIYEVKLLFLDGEMNKLTCHNLDVDIDELHE